MENVTSELDIKDRRIQDTYNPHWSIYHVPCCLRHPFWKTTSKYQPIKTITIIRHKGKLRRSTGWERTSGMKSAGDGRKNTEHLLVYCFNLKPKSKSEGKYFLIILKR